MARRVRPTWAEVDLAAIAGNVRAMKSALRPGTGLMAVVKADGYGHGAVQAALAAREGGAEWLGVAIPEEGVSLREAGVGVRILILGWTPPGQVATVVEHDLAAAVSSLHAAREFARAAGPVEPRLHLKVDTGMGRLGLLPDLAGREEALAICALPGVRVEGIFTHFASADAADKSFATQQLRSFLAFIDELERHGVTFGLRHAANTAAMLDMPDSHLDLVRPGLGVYGYRPSPHVSTAVPLRPALAWKTRVAHLKRLGPGSPVGYGCTYRAIRETTVVTLPVGYADGYPRSLSNNADVLIGGRRCPVIGRVCMDQLMVELPQGTETGPGDEVVLLGTQGGEGVNADELAGRAGTIAHEILTGISPRVPRVYLH
ncbi:MAG: alanine racemase [bacterium]|nr:alanine racemase [bacterium]